MSAVIDAPKLLSDIEATKDDEKRRELLRRSCDLFEIAEPNLTETEAELFDDVLNRLTQKVDTAMRSEISNRIASKSGELHNTANALAFDDSVEVASPVLKYSPALSDETLVAVAETKGQGHMAAIAVRSTLNPRVTDTLVELGDRTVLHNVAGNAGARFSEPGINRLTDRSMEDSDLQAKIADRDDLPSGVMERLIAAASVEVKKTLGDDDRNAEILVDNARRALEKELGLDQVDFIAADRLVRRAAMRRSADETFVRTFAKGGNFGEIVAALVIVMKIEQEQAKRLMMESNALMIAARASDFSAETVGQLLEAGPVFKKLGKEDRERLVEEYAGMSAETSRRVMRFWRTRSKTLAA